MRKSTLFLSAFLAVAGLGLSGTGCDDSGGNPKLITVTITSPANQSFVQGQVAVTVEVTGTVERVELLVDDQVVATAEEAPFDLVWDSTGASESMHRLRAVAYGPGNSQETSQECLVVLDLTAPLVELPDLQLPYLYSGTETLQVAATDDKALGEIRLFVDGTLAETCTESPCQFSWDTTGHADGEVVLLAEAEDTAGNVAQREVPVLVVNDGTVVTFHEGTGVTTFTIPENYAQAEIHKKFHWDMPASTTAILAALQWERTEWSFELAIGTGWCPHSGTKHAALELAGGQVILNHTATELGLTDYTPEQWFAHLAEGASLDLAANVNDGTRVAFVVVLY